MNFSRRKFIQTSAVGAVGLASVPLLQSFSAGANDTIRMGFIGLGQQAMNLLNGFRYIQGVEVVAGADVYGIKRLRFEKQVKEYYPDGEVETYLDYRRVLDRKDIDAVVIATPDHWHAMM